jgi:predicted kinase
VVIVFGGLPGVGKTTLARDLAKRMRAVYLRIDTIEHAILGTGIEEPTMGPAGYAVACRLARDNLGAGLPVIADAVHALEIAREPWRALARAAGVPLLEIHVVCSDLAEHRRRVAERVASGSGHRVCRWETVAKRRFEPWERAHILDTAGLSPVPVAAVLDRLVAAIADR